VDLRRRAPSGPLPAQPPPPQQQQQQQPPGYEQQQPPPGYEQPQAAPYYLEDDEADNELTTRGSPLPWEEPTGKRPPRHWHETTAQVGNPTLGDPTMESEPMEIASSDIETLDPGPYEMTELDPTALANAVADRGPAPAAAPPAAAPPAAEEQGEQRRSPFGANLHQATSLNSGSFQPELQTRIVQNPLADPALARQISERFSATPAPVPEAELGQVAVFFSCHGGSGSSMLAANVASVAAETGRQSCIVDLDLQLGDVLTLLDLEGGCPMSKIAADMENFDWDMLSPLLARHKSGLAAMSQVGHIEELSELDPGRIPTFLRYLQEHFTITVVDGLRDFSDHALAAMDVASRIVLVLTQDVAAIRGARIRLDLLKRLGYSDEKFQVLLNRFDPKNKLSLEHVSEALGLPISITVPNDFRLVHQSITAGRTLKEMNPQAKITMAVDKAARDILDLPEPEPRKGFFGRLFAKKQKKEKKTQS